MSPLQGLVMCDYQCAIILSPLRGWGFRQVRHDFRDNAECNGFNTESMI